MSDCLFCKIIAGDIPSNKVYEDDLCYAFNDIAPQAPVPAVQVTAAGQRQCRAFLHTGGNLVALMEVFNGTTV